MVAAIIVAAGSSRRMGFDKLVAPLAGSTVLARSVSAFEQAREIGEIVLVARKDWVAEFRGLCTREGFTKVRDVIPGGEERHLSVWNGLRWAAARAEWVAVHDAARPLICPRTIAGCLALARKAGAAACAVRVVDTVKRADADGFVSASVEREGLWAMQTPQVFRTGELLAAYAAMLESGGRCTDEVSAVQESGGRVALFEVGEPNFKITAPGDLWWAELVLRGREPGGAP